VRVLLVGSGRHGRPYLAAVRARGGRIALLDNRVTLGSARTRRLLTEGDRTYPVDAEDVTAAWLSAAYRALDDGPVDGVVAFSEGHVLPAALIADELGLRGPGLRAAIVSRDKSLQRTVFAHHGIAQPDALHTGDADDAVAWAAGRYPVVVKPTDGSGSSGVRRIDDEPQLRTWAAAPGRPARFLVERCLEGPELSLETVVQDGAVVLCEPTRKVTGAAPFFVEVGHHVPAGVDPTTRTSLSAVAASVAAALGVRDGLMHLEVRLEPAGPHVIEVAVRTPGDHILELHALAQGVDVFDAVVACALGEPVTGGARSERAAATWFATPGPGRVLAVDGEDDARGLPGVVDLRVDVAPGDTVAALRSSEDRTASAVLVADDLVSLDDLGRRVAGALTIRTVPLHSPTGGTS